MTVLNNGLAGGVDLLFDKENGFLERLMSTPIHRTSVILSRFIFVMSITSLQVLVILGVAFLFGVQPATGLLGIATILFIGMNRWSLCSGWMEMQWPVDAFGACRRPAQLSSPPARHRGSGREGC